jgi:hypothetical protein
MGLLKKLQDEHDGADTVSEEAPELPPDSIEGVPSQTAQAAAAGARQFPRATAPGADEAVSSHANPTEPSLSPDATADAASAETLDQDKDQKSKSEDEHSKKDELPPDLLLLFELLKARDWSVEQAPDPAVRARGAMAWGLIEGEIMKAVDAGHGVEVHKLWGQFAPPGHDGLAKVLQGMHAEPTMDGASQDLPAIIEPVLGQAPAPYIHVYDPKRDLGAGVIDVDVNEIPDEAFADGYKRQNWAQRPTAKPEGMSALDQLLADQNAQQVAAQPGGGGAGAGSVDMLSKMLSAPFTLTAAAGSMVVNTLKALGGKAKSMYAKERINGHSILAAQLDQHAKEVASLTKSLRQQGMEDLISAMRDTGRPAREVCAGMGPGGPYEHLGKRFQDLMQDPDFGKKYARLQEVLDEFNFNASRYAASGVELDLDYSDAIDRNLEVISASTEGFVFEKDGVIKHLQEMARQIGERISELVDSLMGRLKPR